MFLNGYDDFFQPSMRPAELNQLYSSTPSSSQVPHNSTNEMRYLQQPQPEYMDSMSPPVPSSSHPPLHPQSNWMINPAYTNGPSSSTQFASSVSATEREDRDREKNSRQRCNDCLHHLSECSYCHRVASFRLAHDTLLYLTIAVLAYMALRRTSSSS